MAIFKAGQRVRFVTPDDSRIPLGAEGTVLGPSELPGVEPAYRVLFDSVRTPLGYFTVVHYEIVPLTDPDAERFVESLKKLRDEPFILSPSELERVGTQSDFEIRR